MSYTAHIEIEGEDFGTMEMLPQQLARGRYVAPLSQLYLCTKCARIWAKVTVEDQRYFIWNLSCEACGKAHMLEVPGSLWMLWDKEFNNALPRRVMDREVRLALKYWDAQQELEAV